MDVVVEWFLFPSVTFRMIAMIPIPLIHYTIQYRRGIELMNLSGVNLLEFSSELCRLWFMYFYGIPNRIVLLSYPSQLYPQFLIGFVRITY